MNLQTLTLKNFVIHSKPRNKHQCSFLKIIFNSFCLAIKPTDFFEGNNILLSRQPHCTIDTFFHQFQLYLTSRDKIFPYSSPLWLHSDGTIPTRSWFVNQLHIFFENDIAGQSMQAGGATSLAEIFKKILFLFKLCCGHDTMTLNRPIFNYFSFLSTLWTSQLSGPSFSSSTCNCIISPVLLTSFLIFLHLIFTIKTKKKNPQ